MPPEYNPALIERDWYQWWEKSGFFTPSADGDKPAFVIPLPPPNVTGTLHIGHALGDSLQDCLIRQHRMMGYEALWQPGSDHAGIATQVVVEKKLAHEGRFRKDMTREEFIDEVWEWVRHNRGVIFE